MGMNHFVINEVNWPVLAISIVDFAQQFNIVQELNNKNHHYFMIHI